jgi:hypothetical protein
VHGSCSRAMALLSSSSNGASGSSSTPLVPPAFSIAVWMSLSESAVHGSSSSSDLAKISCGGCHERLSASCVSAPNPNPSQRTWKM